MDVRGDVTTVCSRDTVMRTTLTITALKTRRQNIGQSELILDIIDNFHVTHDLKGLVMDEAVAGGCLALGRGVCYLAS